jgi:hypothetical protein
MGGQFKIRYKEHLLVLKNNNNTSAFAEHLTDNGYTIRPMGDIRDILYTTQKGRHLDSLTHSQALQPM